MAKLISKTYGDALFDIALEQAMTDSLLKEALALQKIFEENPELTAFLNHPNIEVSEKEKTVEAIFKDRISEEMAGLLHVVVEKGRQACIHEILEYFIAKVKEYKKIGIAHVTSAVPLSTDQKSQIEQKLLATTSYVQFEMNYAVDESLIGGVVIRIGDRVVDGSVKNKLYELKKDLNKIQLA